MMNPTHGSESLPLAAVQALLARSRVLAFARLSREGTILAVNATMARRTGAAEDALLGKPFLQFLAEDEKDRLRARLNADGRPNPESFLINIVSDDHEVSSLRVLLFTQGSELVLLGEPDVEEDRTVSTQLLRLNNELSVLSRENARRNRELEAARAELARTLKELEQSYWHLRKIQEFMPFCMRCGKIRTGEARWESLLEYLRSNDILVSHGYCPSCSEVIQKEEEL